MTEGLAPGRELAGHSLRAASCDLPLLHELADECAGGLTVVEWYRGSR
ncbi:hypothetical protein BH11MYX1_BH11MYX1_25090 [soil metagenome]